ncbi:pirin family protein [Kitasatospora cineracea]|uniref:pirin family protein n=1 Tax=Kitasatospora sp. NRRL B-11411 TaxID=1463822 RepID=UPI001E400106|nr:pirin family protein [Kitasatospora sp. NRRL B-11411]
MSVDSSPQDGQAFEPLEPASGPVRKERGRADLRRAAERYLSEPAEGITTRHAFSFAGHYDPKNTSFGALLACNEETLAPGAGYEAHRHSDTEIVTWVVSGALAHRDDAGHASVVRRGTVQVQSTGTGISHTERNPGGATEPVTFVQMWLQPDQYGAAPGFGLAPVPDGDGLTLLASGRDADADRALRLRRGDAALWLVRTPAWMPLPELPAAPYRYVHVVAGSVGYRTVPGPQGGGRSAGPGDSVRITGDAFADPTAGEDGVELLLWEMRTPVQFG